MSHKDAYKQVITDTINGVDVADKLHDILQAKLQARLSEGVQKRESKLPEDVISKLLAINNEKERFEALVDSITKGLASFYLYTHEKSNFMNQLLDSVELPQRKYASDLESGFEAFTEVQ